MPDEDKREWPTFADILSELDSLGGSRTAALSALSTRELPHEPTVSRPDIEPIVTPEPASSDLDTNLLDTPPSESENVFDISARSPLEPAPEVDASDPETESSTEGLAAPDPSVDAPLSNSGLIDWSKTPLADDAKAPPPAEIDWTILAPEWDVTAASGQEPIKAEDSETVSAEPESGAVFPFNPQVHAAPGSTDSSEPALGADFTSTEWSSTTQESTAMAPAPEQPAIDSIATANAIESDLQDIFALDQVGDEDNVIPLHPSSEDHSAAVVGLDTVFDPETDEEALKEWVGIDPTPSAAEDPWAYMRPAEDEEAKGGFWSGRSRLFGGTDRKAQKESRRQAERTKDALESDSDGPECPECGSAGQVDLDDPVGGKLHLSCGSCENVWSEPTEGHEELKGA